MSTNNEHPESTAALPEAPEVAPSGERAEGTPMQPAVSMEAPVSAEKLRRRNDRLSRFIKGCAESSPPAVAKYLNMLAPVSQFIYDVFMMAFPIIDMAIRKGLEIYSKLPHDHIVAIYGLAVCFFGGHFAASIAVIEAFRMSGGGQKIYECFEKLYDCMLKLGAANKKDDERDDNNDGVADVDQISPAALFLRKFKLALRTIDPDIVNEALHGLYLGLISAAMVVRHKFAKTIALGNSIGNLLIKSTSVVLIPPIAYIMPTYVNWFSLVVAYTCKAIGMSIAWWMQFWQSVIQSATLGGITFGRAVLNILVAKGHVKVQSHEDTYLDEIIGWSTAAVGALFQITFGYFLFFPLNIILLPLTAIEWFLRWTASNNLFTPMAATVV